MTAPVMDRLTLMNLKTDSQIAINAEDRLLKPGPLSHAKCPHEAVYFARIRHNENLPG